MDYLEYYKRLERLKTLIERGSAHSPSQLSRMFNCTEKTIRNMINRLRNEGVEIKYCKRNKKYFIE